MDGVNLYFKMVPSTKGSGKMTPFQDMVDLLEMTVIMREMWGTVEQMDQELMKTIIGIIQDNGKMIKEMGSDKSSLKIRQKNLLVVLLMINIMVEADWQLNSTYIKESLKKVYLMDKVVLNIIMIRYSRVLFLMVSNIWDDIHILMEVIMMECIKIMSQMEQDNSFGQMG